MPRIYSGVSLLPWRRVFRATKKAPGGGSRLVSPLSERRTEPGYGMRRDGRRGRQEGGQGRIVGGRYGGVSSWTCGTVGSRVRRQFFLLEFSKGNDLRYISKGFLLVGKRVRRRYPPTGEATACPHPAPPTAPCLRGLPDNLHFSTINLTFVQLFLPGDRLLLHLLACPTFHVLLLRIPWSRVTFQPPRFHSVNSKECLRD